MFLRLRAGVECVVGGQVPSFCVVILNLPDVKSVMCMVNCVCLRAQEK